MAESLEQAPDRLELLLMQALDGELRPEDRAELATLADADIRLAEWAELRASLREALSEPVIGSVDLVAAVLDALNVQDDWAPIGLALREELHLPGPDLADAIMSALSPGPEPDPDTLLSAMYDGELSPAQRAQVVDRLRVDRAASAQLTAFAELGRLVREDNARQVGAADLQGVWAQVALGIGMADPEEVPGWEPLGVALREAVQEKAQLSAAEHAALSGAILNALPRPRAAYTPAPAPAPEPPRSIWRLMLSNPTLWAAALTALVLVAVQLQGPGPAPVKAPVPVAAAPEPEPFQDIALQDWNEAEIHNIEYSADVAVQVVALEDGAPVLLMIEELDGDGVPL